MAQSERGSYLILLVAITKLLEAALLLVAALAARQLLHGDVQTTLLHWANAVRVDPENRFAHGVLTHVTGLSPRKLEEISLGTLMYGLLFAVEGTGLVLHKRWAEWVTVISTSGFLPVEVYEVIERVRLVRVIVLLINLLIVVYLIARLVRESRSAKAEGIAHG